MINKSTIARLMANWGDRADAMACNAEIRLYDSSSDWCAYIFAMNPEDPDQVVCIFNGFDVGVETASMDHLLGLFNPNGDFPLIDRDFRPMDAQILLKKLTERKNHGS